MRSFPRSARFDEHGDADFAHEEADRDQIRRSLGTTLRAIISQRLVPRADGAGRVPAVEVMTNAPIVRKLITEGRLEKLRRPSKRAEATE